MRMDPRLPSRILSNPYLGTTIPPWKTQALADFGLSQYAGPMPTAYFDTQLIRSKRRHKGFSYLSYKSGRTLVAALQDPQQRRRASDVIRLLPQVAKNYFKSPFRRALFGGISLLGGFYVAQTISLSFGALGVNDVIAAALCVLITEYITRFYHTRVKATFPLALLNNFKMGFTYGLFIDAFKLAS
ncbi:hypothetical protein O6H91_08G062100 [Diphasiastrum complanatum]|uniref:Uncharacterized protein n=1 Tax=Diphasiastrum complanatum TaxID=34168 RepID=A0ACC2CY88_DIPCM|nr:hypothetical protein O6H91_08G062100 [Diphasiastrum complanatum]